MKGTITTKDGTTYIGLKCNPSECPRCHEHLISEIIDINLRQQTCPTEGCNYSARDRVGSIRDAEDIRDSQPAVRISRRQ